MRIALGQLVSGFDLNDNIQTILRLMDEAAQSKTEYVFFPENALSMHSVKLFEIGQNLLNPNSALTKIQTQCQKLQIGVVLGSVPIPEESISDPERPQRVRAATLVYDAQGVLICRYDKIHLFDAQVEDSQGKYVESNYIAPGCQPTICQLNGLNFGLSICYDLRFPELFRQLRLAGAHVLVVPAAFTEHTGRAHWEVLLRARAIENQCYVLGIDQGGNHSPQRRTFGHTMVVDPWGEVVKSIELGEGLVIADLNLERVLKIRQQMPIMSHRYESLPSPVQYP